MANKGSPQRPFCAKLDAMIGKKIQVLDHGYIRLVDYMGVQASVAQAARVSYQKGTRRTSEDVGLVRRLYRDRHTSPLEQLVITFDLRMPIFVMRQWVRHRTARLNEESARYSELESIFYLPKRERMVSQSKKNKQGGGKLLDDAVADHIAQLLLGGQDAAARDYAEMIRADYARELARINLPLSIYTRVRWQIDLHNLLHFLSLRNDPHAQYEIRVYAELIYEKYLKIWVPDICRAFEDHTLKSLRYSFIDQQVVEWARKEYSGGNWVDSLRLVLAANPKDEDSQLFRLAKQFNVSPGEISELLSKLVFLES
ncbi:MAG: FAD-dependent thymidylate synthase [Patescibacteria group bacterium]